MLKVGITGGIGSGKTSACTVFETLGIPVYYADTQAKQLMDTDPGLKASLQGYFGSSIYCDGRLDRRRMAEIIFNDKTALEKVNNWVHPAVARDFESWCTWQTSPYVLEEAAIIFESNTAHRFDRIILVTAPDAIRIERVCARDHITQEAVRKRMANQWPEKKKISLADYIIHNGNTLVTPQIMEIHRKLLNIEY
ncbi:MAG: dephospho-CoA kinase [Bacteroidales bacterium]|jgi:dephospho-CoA kinase|nr:dephospho-CoA kinase [Bacteroidales bacterium]